MKLNLHIDRLVLHGTDWGPSTLAEFEAGVRVALEHALRTHEFAGGSPVSSAVGTSERMQVVLPAPCGASEMGVALGQAIHGRVRR